MRPSPGCLDEISWPTVTLSVFSILLLLALRRWAPRSLPGPLIVVALGILLAVATGLADRGVALVGTIPPGLPEFAAPDLAMVQVLVPAAMGVALMAFVESIAAARAFTAEGEPEVEADQELRAPARPTWPVGASRPSRPAGDCPRRPSTGRRAPAARWPGS